MTVSLTLTANARNETVKKTIIKAGTLFTEIHGCNVHTSQELMYGSPFWMKHTIQKITQQPTTQKSLFGKTTINQQENIEEVITLDWNVTLDKLQLNIKSFNQKYDEAAIWIGAQLEKLFDTVKLQINDPTKLGYAIGWRCAYCNTSNKAEIANCTHCGAPRAW
jgi:hypothetical protein